MFLRCRSTHLVLASAWAVTSLGLTSEALADDLDRGLVEQRSGRAHQGSPADEASAPDTTQRAQDLYRQAKTAYDLADYDTAIELFTESYKLTQAIPDEALRTKALLALQYNLARSHVEAFSIDRDPQHLRIGQNLLKKQLAVAGLSDEDRSVAEDLMGEIEVALAETEASRSSGASNTSSAAASDLDAVAEEEPVDTSTGTDAPQPDADRRAMTPLRLGGIVSLAGAGAGLGALAAGAVIASQAQQNFETATTGTDVSAAERRGNTGNIVAISGAVSAGVLAATGVALLVVDAKQRRAAGNVSLLPALSPQGSGLFITGRF